MNDTLIRSASFGQGCEFSDNPSQCLASLDDAAALIDVSKRRGSFQYGPLSIHLPKGYVTGLVGVNGAGKTTTMKLLLRMIKPDAGTVEMPDHSQIGVVLDQPFLVPDWTVKAAAQALRPSYPTWDDGLFASFVNLFGLRENEKVKDLSRGESTKLMLALALAHRPELLILDEPTAGLDPAARLQLLDVLRGYLSDDERTVLYSTHITNDLEHFADFIIAIHNGQIAFTGTPADILASYAMVKGGASSLRPELAHRVHGLRRTAYGFEGLIPVSESADFGSDVVLEEPTIDQIVAHLGRGE